MERHAHKPVRDKAEEKREETKEAVVERDPVEVASDDSFPASDPPSFTPVKGEKRSGTDKNKSK